MAMRLLELTNPADSVAACRLIAGDPFDSTLRGWASFLNFVPAQHREAACDVATASRTRLVFGQLGALVVGTLDALEHSGRGFSEIDQAWKPIGESIVRRSASINSPPPPLVGFLPARRGTLVMGIVNVTPDSFSDGGKFLDPRAAIEQGLRLIEEGADILDVGGEATNPFGAAPVSEDEELRRVVPVVTALAGRAPISVDTRHARVAAAALDAGAAMVNDITALRDESLARLVAARRVPVCLMHMRGEPATMQQHTTYGDLVGEVMDELSTSLGRAVGLGVAFDRTLLDPGLGFAKTAEQSLHLVARLRELKQLGRPLLVGPSRKSFVGKLTGKPPGERLFGTVAAVTACAMAGAAVVRVHDVAAARDALAIADGLVASTLDGNPVSA